MSTMDFRRIATSVACSLAVAAAAHAGPAHRLSISAYRADSSTNLESAELVGQGNILNSGSVGLHASLLTARYEEGGWEFHVERFDAEGNKSESIPSRRISTLETLLLPVEDLGNGNHIWFQIVPGLQWANPDEAIDLTPKNGKFYAWQFTGSVFLDGEHRSTMRIGGEIGWVSFPGVAKVEFSLQRIDGFQALGSLLGRVLEIEGDEHQLRIVGASLAHELDPKQRYTAYARWSEPDTSLEELLEMAERGGSAPRTPEEREKLRQQILAGKGISYGALSAPE